MVDSSIFGDDIVDMCLFVAFSIGRAIDELCKKYIFFHQAQFFEILRTQTLSKKCRVWCMVLVR